MKLSRWIGFGVLCLLGGSGLTLESVLPRLVPGLAGLGLRLLLMAALASVLRPPIGRLRNRVKAEIACWGAVLLCLLPVLFSAAGSRVDSLTEILVSTLIPAGTVFGWAQRGSGFGPASPRMTLLVPALMGLGGAALLISYSLPTKPAGWLWLGLMLVAALFTGASVLRLHELTRTTGTASALTLICAGGGIAALALFWISPVSCSQVNATSITVEAGRFLLMDIPVLALTVWLLRELPPTAFAARYLLVPFVAVAEAFVIARPQRDWTMYAGTALLLGGSGLLLRSVRMKSSDMAENSIV